MESKRVKLLDNGHHYERKILDCHESNSVEESKILGKRIKVEHKFSRNGSELGVHDDYGNNHVGRGVHNVLENARDPLLHFKHVCKTIDLKSVRKMFLEGMETPFKVKILDINECSSYVMQTRWEIFNKQIDSTQKYRESPNLCYAWYPATKDVLSSIVTYGLAHCGSRSTAYGLGVHLTSVKCSVASAFRCNVDENGVRHMVLCRVILGNVEPVPPGSTQSHPSSEIFDNGVDDVENPINYIIWNMNMNTHIYPECVVSFKMSYSDQGKEQSGVPEVKLCLDISGQGHIDSSAVESGKAPSSGLSTAKIPNVPFLPWSALFDAISPDVPQDKMKKVYAYYEGLKSNKLSRQDFHLKLRLIVGDELLKTCIMSIKSKIQATE